MGVATVSATVRASAPGYVAVTEMVGGVTTGYCEMGNWVSATRPRMMIRKKTTQAPMGRSMKNRESMAGPSVPCRGGGRGALAGEHVPPVVEPRRLGNDLRAVAGPLHAPDDDPVVGLQALRR